MHLKITVWVISGTESSSDSEGVLREMGNSGKLQQLLLSPGLEEHDVSSIQIHFHKTNTWLTLNKLKFATSMDLLNSSPYISTNIQSTYSKQCVLSNCNILRTSIIKAFS